MLTVLEVTSMYVLSVAHVLTADAVRSDPPAGVFAAPASSPG